MPNGTIRKFVMMVHRQGDWLTAKVGVSVVRQFETDGGLIYGSDRLI
jgi:hypothetical protein